MTDSTNFGRQGIDAVQGSLFAAQGRQAEIMSRANEIFANAAKALWETQADLFQVEAEGGLKSFPPFKPGGDPAEALASFCKQWRDNSEKVISRMRTINDVTRQFSWQLFDLYADSLRPPSNGSTQH